MRTSGKTAVDFSRAQGQPLYLPARREPAMAAPLLTRRRGLRFGYATWATWDESSESSLASSDIFVCFMENTAAGGNETGYGGDLTGDDLVLTQNGGIAGASGGKRYLAGVNDYFTFTEPNAAAFLKRSDKKFSVVMKWSDITTPYTFFNARDVGFDTKHKIVSRNALLLYGQVGLGGGPMQTVNDIPGAGVVYICIWSNGTDTRIGMKATTRPTKWSDFAANDRATGAFSVDHSAATYTGRAIGAHANGISDFVVGYLHYVVFAKTVLIDEAL